MNALATTALVWNLICSAGIQYGPFSTASECSAYGGYVATQCGMPRLTFPSVEWRDRFRKGCGSDHGISCRCVSELP